MSEELYVERKILNKILKDFERSDPKTNKTMNKKEYMKPAMRVVKIQAANIICTSPNGVTGVDGGDAGIGYGGGGSGPAHARSFGGYDDWDEEE